MRTETLRYTLVVNAPPHTGDSAHGAYRFARALLERGHQLVRVFFYRDGVHNGTRLTVVGGDELNLPEAWSALARDHGVDLVLCVGAAERRGILDLDQSRRHARDSDNLASGFRIAGLGQLIDATVDSDRVISFSD